MAKGTFKYPNPKDKNWPKDKKEAKEMIEEHNKQPIRQQNWRLKAIEYNNEAYEEGWERIFGERNKNKGKE